VILMLTMYVDMYSVSIIHSRPLLKLTLVVHIKLSLSLYFSLFLVPPDTLGKLVTRHCICVADESQLELTCRGGLPCEVVCTGMHHFIFLETSVTSSAHFHCKSLLIILCFLYLLYTLHFFNPYSVTDYLHT
jgi:hypothetical protein